MSDIDTYADSMALAAKDAKLVKQDRFGATAVWQLLQAFQTYPGGAAEELKRIGETRAELTAFTLASLAFPMHLVTVKLGKRTPSFSLLKGLMKTGLKTHIEEMWDSMSEEDDFGIVFDSEGSGFNALVLHNSQDIVKCMSDWYVTYPLEEGTMYLSTYKAFLAAATITYSGWSVPQT